jgi:HEAT repeat protein
MSSEYDLLLRELTSDDPVVRVHGLESLEASGVLRAIRVLEPVRRLLAHDPDWLVRVSAAEALGAFGDTSPDTLACLTTALETDGAPLVRAYAAESLAELDATGSTELIAGRLQHEQEPRVRASMLMALAWVLPRPAAQPPEGRLVL